MPTRDRTQALDAGSARSVIERATTGRPGATGLGIEVELFPIATDPLPRRPPIDGVEGVAARLTAAHAVTGRLRLAEGTVDPSWESGGPTGFRITFEPGGQLEASTCYSDRPTRTLDTAEHATRMLADALGNAGILLAATGIDVWEPGGVPQQLAAPRYMAMDRYLADCGGAGRTMMRDTCALQVNLDLAKGAEAQRRWLLTNLLAPLATATFANSPSLDGATRSRRSLTWQHVDPTRTGFPPLLADDRASLTDQLERFAMDAHVLLVTHASGKVSPGKVGWRFADWVRHGHTELGWPTTDDLATHLSTLFPEVRPRGYLEVRSIDALPARWRRVPAVLYVGAVYDDHARERILDVLVDRPPPLDEQLRQAASTGLADPATCARAVEVWSFALEGAARLPAGSVTDRDLEVAERFLDRFTLRGRCPADELGDELRSGGPVAALRWAAEPTTHAAGVGTPRVSREEGSRP